ncbi:hypothetical protein R1sor_023908 [Riccia sorocarpa]|uniref:Uncharacterized protein n=1 Tax=Riccia sorocarpa TaxID=122646 RepID=A0ABD3GR57_9MARC
MASEQFDAVRAPSDDVMSSKDQKSEVSRLDERDEAVKKLDGSAVRTNSNGGNPDVHQVSKEKMEDVMEEGDTAMKLAQQDKAKEPPGCWSLVKLYMVLQNDLVSSAIVAECRNQGGAGAPAAGGLRSLEKRGLSVFMDMLSRNF